MIYTYDRIINSIADQLAAIFPAPGGGCLYPVRRSPSQDTEYPCFYIFLTIPELYDEVGDKQKRVTGFDVVFVQQRNTPDQYGPIATVLEALDMGFKMLRYNDGESVVPLHVLERNASIEDQELHYKFTLKQRVSLPVPVELMQTMEEANVEIKEYKPTRPKV